MSRAMWTAEARRDLETLAEFIVHRDGRRRTARQITREIRDKCDH
ncbi:MAG: type II toxin-antitoxin system RelE/ParE family toxin [Pirellulales bacterium]|nr:type II toxin-antitoxin system RelE/ParE family toxin [Pirellulales bacterium]